MAIGLNRLVPLAAPLALVLIAGGCQKYTPRPLDPTAHRAVFTSRTPASPEVADFARHLAESSADAPTSFEPADGLSLPEGEVVALVYNPDLRLARLRAGVAAAGEQYAGLWEDPVLSTDLARIIQSTEHPWKVFASVGFTIPLSGRLEAEKLRAGDEHRAELVRAWAQEWTTRIELRRRWVEWSSARAQAEVMREFTNRLDQIVTIVNQIADAGEMSRVESRLFQIERVTRATELTALESGTQQAELALKVLLGLPPSATVKFHPAFTSQSPNPPDLLEPRETNTDLAIATAEYAVAERTLALEMRKQYPDLTIGPGYGREDGQDQFLLGLSIPLPILNRNRQGIATASAQRDLARASFETTYERVTGELTDAVLRRSALSQQREAFEQNLVPLVDEQYAETRRVAELGEVNTLVLLETLTRQQEAKLRLIQAREAESLAEIRIEELLGPAAELPTQLPQQGAKP